MFKYLMRRWRNGAIEKKKMVHNWEVGDRESNQPVYFLYLGHFFHLIFRWLLTIPERSVSPQKQFRYVS